MSKCNPFIYMNIYSGIRASDQSEQFVTRARAPGPSLSTLLIKYNIYKRNRLCDDELCVLSKGFRGNEWLSHS